MASRNSMRRPLIEESAVGDSSPWKRDFIDASIPKTDSMSLKYTKYDNVPTMNRPNTAGRRCRYERLTRLAPNSDTSAAKVATVGPRLPVWNAV